MDWLSFFVGALVGWIAEWVIDIFYWRRRYQTCQKEKQALQARLKEVEKRLRTFQVKGWELEGEPQPTPPVPVAAEGAEVTPPDGDLAVRVEAPTVALPIAQLDGDLQVPEVALPEADVDLEVQASEVGVPDWSAQALEVPPPQADAGLEVKAPEVDMPDWELETLEVAPPQPGASVDVTGPEVDRPDWSLDDLFDGLRSRFPDVDLGSSIARLKASFPDLDLKTALDGLRADFPHLDIDGAVEGLRARLPHLAAGAVETGERLPELPTIVPQQPDDLKLLEGIGPRISQLLMDNGILTFDQLANTSVERLQAILRAGGPNFQLADPATWPEQSRLAADGAWDELRVLQHRLIGGHRTRRRRR